MRLLGVRLRRFMRFVKAYVNLENRGAVLIEGDNRDDDSADSNGAGKSTLVDAIVWCLYGVTTHEPSAEGDDVVNEKYGRNCEVSVEFMIGEYQHYEITRRRAWKKGGKTVQLSLVSWDPKTQSGAAGDMTRGRIKDTQEVITKLIGMSVSTFRQACIFGQGRAYRFSRLTDSEKKGVLDEMLGSELYAQASELASKRAAQIERDLDKVEISLDSSREALQVVRDRLAKLEGKAKEAQRIADEEREQMKHELASIEMQWKKLGDPVDVERLRKKQTEAKNAEIEANRKLRPALEMVAKTQAEIDRLKTERLKLVKLEGASCLLCKQHVSEAHIHIQTEKIDEAIRRSSDLVKQQKSDGQLLAQFADKLQRDTDKCRDEIVDATNQTHQRERLEDQIKALTKKAKTADTSAHWIDLIVEANNEIKRLEEKCKSGRQSIKRYKKELTQLRFWQAGFGTKGLQSLLLDSVLPYLNAKLELYTNALTAGNIAVEFRTQRELKGGGMRDDFHVHVTNKHGATKYAMNSQGERAKVDLVVGLALQDMAASRSRVPINVAFFDECFDGLDERGIDRAVQVLSELKRESAFVITHSDGLRAFFQNRIVVVKENGISRVEGETNEK